jgi:hypothetical protein
LQLQLHPSVQLLDLHWAVGPTWHAVKHGQDDLEAPEALEHQMLVWRLGMNTQWKSLTQTEADFVQGLLAGRSFGQLCEALCAQVSPERAAATAVALLRDLLTMGAICALPTPVSNTSTH